MHATAVAVPNMAVGLLSAGPGRGGEGETLMDETRASAGKWLGKRGSGAIPQWRRANADGSMRNEWSMSILRCAAAVRLLGGERQGGQHGRAYDDTLHNTVVPTPHCVSDGGGGGDVIWVGR